MTNSTEQARRAGRGHRGVPRACGHRRSVLPTVVGALAAVVAVSLSVAVLVAPSAAVATDSDALIRHGIELRRAGKDEEALKEFQQAYDLDKTPRSLAQMGFAEQALGRWGVADQHLRRALESPGDPWIRKNHGTVDAALKSIARHVGRLDVSGSPVGAEIRVDGELIGRLPLPGPVSVTAGGLALEVRAPGFLPIVRATTVSVDELTRETFHLQPLSPTAEPTSRPASPPGPAVANAAAETRPAAPPAAGTAAGGATSAAAEPSSAPGGSVPRTSGPPASPPPDREGVSTRRVVAISAAGLAVVSLAFGVVEHLSWQSKVSSFVNMAGCNPDQPQRGGGGCQSLYDDGQHARTLAFVGYGLTAAFAATAAIVYFTDPARGAEPAKVACGPGTAVATGMSCALRF